MEYLLIVGIVVVISLVVVGLVISQSDSASNVSSTSGEIVSKVGVGGLSLSSSVMGEDGNGLLVLKNLGVDSVYVNKISVNSFDHNFVNELLPGSGDKSFKLQDVNVCDGSKKSYSIKVYYTSVDDLSKTSDFQTISINCVPVVTPSGSVVEETFSVINVAPVVVLNSPVDNYSTADTRISFVFTPSDSDGTIASCSLNITGLMDANSSSNIVNGVENTLDYTLSVGSYDWNISCTDNDGDTNTSENRSLDKSLVGGDNLVAHYLMNDNAASTVVIDSSPSGVNAIMSSQNTSSRTTTGLINNALTFQTGEYFTTTSLGVLSALSSNSWSIAFWGKRAVTNIHSTWFNWTFSGAGVGYAYYNKDNGQMKWCIGNTELGGSTAFAANTWAHWVFVRNGNSFNLYKNGVSLTTGTNSATYTTTSLTVAGSEEIRM